MAAHAAVSTQEQHPWRATARTMLAGVVALAAAAPLIWTAATGDSPEAATGAGATFLIVSGAITRVMAVPAVNAVLAKVGLGTVPAN